MSIRTIYTTKTPLLILQLFFFSLITRAQNAILVPFDSLHWNIEAKEAIKEEFQGQACIKMVDGAAYLKDSFENGIVEFDISFDKERSFPGLMFRIADAKNFEFLYLRPHHSGDPDAIQYCPIVYGNDTWQLYAGEGFGAQKDFAMNSWIHMKVVISGDRAELYLNHESNSSLYMYQLQRRATSGGLALDNHSTATVRFANFSYTKMDNAPLKNPPKIPVALAAGIVRQWQVSNTFNEKLLAGKMLLNKDELSRLSWQSMATEELGFINIGKYLPKTTEQNTVLARFAIVSDKTQIKKMAIGFSDRCRVYLNGQLLYAGNNGFKSRDYRFYGTIGFWDELFLDLKKGSNEVTIAVSEDFGGWGVEARFDDLNGLVVTEK
jgi:hypothetical protein